MVDTATIYDNEKEIGAIIPKDLFVTTKLWRSHQVHHLSVSMCSINSGKRDRDHKAVECIGEEAGEEDRPVATSLAWPRKESIQGISGE